MKRKLTVKKISSAWLFVIPALIPLIVFWIYPILRSIYISFTDWDYMSPNYNFVFFDNFIALFKDQRFYDALWNTVVLTLGTLIPTILKEVELLNSFFFHHGLHRPLQFPLYGHGFMIQVPVSPMPYWTFWGCRDFSGLRVRKRR